MSTSRTKKHARSSCPVACSLDVLGDKWTLLVIRDLLLGRSRYGEFQASPESIPTNILAERLRRIVDAGIAKKKAYQRNPIRYEYHLTKKGHDLAPIIRECVAWGEKHIPGTKVAMKKKN